MRFPAPRTTRLPSVAVFSLAACLWLAHGGGAASAPAVDQRPAEEARFYVVWGLEGGGYHGALTVEDGEFLDVRPWQWEPADVLDTDDPHRVTWIGNVYRGTDGLEFTARGSAATRFHLQFTEPHRADVVFGWKDVTSGSEHVVPLGKENDFAAYGVGDIRRGPRSTRSLTLPPLYRPPMIPAEGILSLPDDWFRLDAAPVLRLSGPAAGPLSARRLGGRDGKLVVEISAAEPFSGTAELRIAGKPAARCQVDGSVYLSLLPRVDTMPLTVEQPGATSALSIPTTLVEVRARELLVNGEPFLVKGTLPRGLNDRDAEYLKSLGANTLRMRPTDQLPYLARFGFMAIASCHTGPGKLCQKAETDEAFREGVATYRANTLPLARGVAHSPFALIVQVGNEQVTGRDPWVGRFRPPHPFERLDLLLAELYNDVKPLAPMLPVGYANCAFGYVAPDFLDVYLHNTYLDRDRNWPPLEEFLGLECGRRRPYVHTEFGANVYMPQAHLGGPNSPVLEKIHAWNYRHRWATYLAAGTIGGTNYCLYDYDPSKVNRHSWDQGFTNFGILTFDRQPKLACWELWHLWRDFEVSTARTGGLRIDYRRDYRARDCRLTVVAVTEERTSRLDDFNRRSSRTIELAVGSAPFRWRIDYTTHGGLPMQATGGCPQSVEEAAFVDRLRGRPTYPFLRELFDAEVCTVDGRPAPATLKEIQREDGLVPILFRKPSGVAYVTAFSRKRPATGLYHRRVSLDVACRGEVTAVDELTGEPIASPTVAEQTASGTRLENLDVPYLPSQYTARAVKPIALPVIRIMPATKISTAPTRRLPSGILNSR